MIDLFAMGMEIDRAYGGVLRDQCSVDFVRGGSSPYDYPIIGFDEDGEPYVELESLEWGRKQRVRLVPEGPPGRAGPEAALRSVGGGGAPSEPSPRRGHPLPEGPPDDRLACD